MAKMPVAGPSASEERMKPVPKRFPPDDYKPPPDVAKLPLERTDGHDLWWSWYIGDEFRASVATRGKRYKNAKEWTVIKFHDEFLKDYHPEINWTEHDGEWYWSKIGDSIYNFIYRHTFRSTVYTPKAEKKAAPKKYSYAHDTWRQANDDIWRPILVKAVAANGGPLDVNSQQQLSKDTFKTLPQDEQKKWHEAAKVQLTTSQQDTFSTSAKRTESLDGHKNKFTP
ncbi:hypothetical protein FRC09_009246 [Ceratobasidium sp. 395]|nr:hypothetical protein FRC09_009246 [Ceratobasidium sp. 395]